MAKESWDGRIIEIIKNPTEKMIQNLKKKKFTGLTYCSGRNQQPQQPWNVWFLGSITHCEKTKGEAIRIIVQLIAHSRQ